ncbi:CLUMA_CG018274, isoform A [Clunio marinus]|uniref:CLUMA_CG018274, isoform A n=1 Tax=Clunio marinus TaxID=568069 RepID=A0A1J1IZV6_9DIPT|nr:CLUMA_CG018274, isoform A [Clunio marinus]
MEVYVTWDGSGFLCSDNNYKVFYSGENDFLI